MSRPGPDAPGGTRGGVQRRLSGAKVHVERMRPTPPGARLPDAEAVRAATERILHGASRAQPRVEYLRDVARVVLEHTAVDAVELWLRDGARGVLCRATRTGPDPFELTGFALDGGAGRLIGNRAGTADASPLCLALLLRGAAPRAAARTGRVGRRPTGRTGEPAAATPTAGRTVLSPRGGGSAALFPLVVGEERVGVLALFSSRRRFFAPRILESCERLADTLGNALVSQQAQAALHERVKELTCLYGITQVAEHPDTAMRELLRGIVQLLPPAWQYPEITQARIVLDGRSYATPGFSAGVDRQEAPVVIGKAARGVVEVVYTHRRPVLDEGPFLKEERALIDAVATQLALIVERRETGEERSRLQEQLRHADRLATIGQLAAGVAHELNEPLGNVLGFAQLAARARRVAPEVRADLEKIVAASLHAREVVRKLVLFARQAPPIKTAVDLNQVVENGLYFLEARCAKQGIRLVRELGRDLPMVVADPSQLQQVLVNLVVNAIQAMPEGGRLALRTRASRDSVHLVVIDTGVGMAADVKAKIFLPFFTTKDVDQGTGLGLSVVHGIVTAHGGSIEVESEPGRGSRFEIRLPLPARADEEGGDQHAGRS